MTRIGIVIGSTRPARHGTWADALRNVRSVPPRRELNRAYHPRFIRSVGMSLMPEQGILLARTNV